MIIAYYDLLSEFYAEHKLLEIMKATRTVNRMALFILMAALGACSEGRRDMAESKPSVQLTNKGLMLIQSEAVRQLSFLNTLDAKSVSDAEKFEKVKEVVKRQLGEEVDLQYATYKRIADDVKGGKKPGKIGQKTRTSTLETANVVCDDCAMNISQTLDEINVVAYQASDYTDLQSKMTGERQRISGLGFNNWANTRLNFHIDTILYYAQFDYDEEGGAEPHRVSNGGVSKEQGGATVMRHRRCGFWGSVCIAVSVATVASAAAAGTLGNLGAGITAGAAFYYIARCCICCPWTCHGINVSC